MTFDPSKQIKLDSDLIEAMMHFPNDDDIRDAWYNYRTKPRIIATIYEKNEWPVTLDKDVFDILADNNPSTPTEKDLIQRKTWGWMIGMAFDFYIRAAVNNPHEKFDPAKGPLTSHGKFEFHLEGLTGEQRIGGKRPHVPGTESERPRSQTTFMKARKHLWPVAHYWCAEFNSKGDERYPNPKTARDWSNFMMFSETLRVIGETSGIFEALAPDGKYDPEMIFFHSEIPAFSELTIPGLDEEERRRLQTYISTTTFKRRNRP